MMAVDVFQFGMLVFAFLFRENYINSDASCKNVSTSTKMLKTIKDALLGVILRGIPLTYFIFLIT